MWVDFKSIVRSLERSHFVVSQDLRTSAHRNLLSSMDADEHQVDLSHLAQRLLSYGGYTSKCCCRAAPGDITSEYIHTAFTEPVIIPTSSAAKQQLGMVLPPSTGLTVPEIAKVLGYDKEVQKNPKLASPRPEGLLISVKPWGWSCHRA